MYLLSAQYVLARAAVVNARVKSGDNVLITGIGGGVALLALQICVALGANVYVTSGSQDKIAKAVALGAKGGVSYKNCQWKMKSQDFFIVLKEYAIQLSGRNNCVL